MQHRSQAKHPLTRRELMSLSAAALAGLVATACGGGATPSPASPLQTPGMTPVAQATTGTAQPTAGTQQPGIGTQQSATVAAPASTKEAPQLAALVRDGKLPPVEQRLPQKPLVVKPLERSGKYGGTWRNVILGGQDLAQLTLTIGYEHLVRWDLQWNEVLPNVAESFEANADGSEYTFKLREGMKWSDGQPFTADDILFWWEDVTLHKEISSAGPPVWMRAGGKPGAVEKVDQSTIRFKFAAPNGLLLQNLCTAEGAGPTRYPKHYLQQFHQKYNTTTLDQLVRENTADGWVRLFQTKGGGIPGTPYDARWQNKDLPTLHGWYLTAPFTGTQRVVAERNPYYFKVDPEGNQLPYIDRVTYDVTGENEVVLLKTLNGELDLVVNKVNSLSNKAVFTDNQQKGGYRFIEIVTNFMNTVIIALNLTHKDPTKRQVFQNKDVRIGLSHAINRQEIIDVVYVGQGEPWQAGPRRESPFYHERLAKQYTEYDVKKANEYLDKAGFSRKDAQGIRLGPDGKPISFAVEVAGTVNQTWLDTMELVVQHWKRVGIDAQVKNEDRSLFYTRKGANEHDAAVWGGATGLRDALLDPRWYFPHSAESNYAEAWQTWYNNPSGSGAQTPPEEPPEATRRQMELYEQFKATITVDRQADLFKQILEIAADQFYVIGISLPPNDYGIVKNNLKNVPGKTPGAWLFQYPAVTNTSQYFFE